MTFDTSSLNAAIEQAASMEDHSVTVEGGSGFKREYPVPGKHMCRFIEYVELGKQARKPGKYGQKPPVDQVRLVFELVGKKAFKEITVNGETKLIGFPVRIQVNKTQSPKGDFHKVFTQLDAGRGKKHMAQMLGEAFVVQITAVDKDGNVLTGKEDDYQSRVKYLNCFSGTPDAKLWGFSAPLHEDPETGDIKRIQVPAATQELRCFLWNVPTFEMWQSIYIDGEYESKAEDGSVTKRSKNIVQEIIMRAVNWEGSPMHTMLAKDGMLPEQLDKAPSSVQEAMGDPLTDDGGADLGTAFPSEAAGMDDVPF